MAEAGPTAETVPTAEAPIMYGSPLDGADRLPWSWAEERLVAARNYWIATTRPDGRPHARPIWGVWLDGSLWFSTGSLAVRNLAHNDAVTAHLESGDAAVIVEGHAARVVDHAALQTMCDRYGPKYEWPMRPDGDGILDSDGTGGPVFRIVPDVAFGWEMGMRSPTRWRFAR